jgi:hypothetical protein
MRLILSSYEMPNDLNLRSSSRVSVALIAIPVTAPVVAVSLRLFGCPDWQASVQALPALAALGSVLLLNLPFYRFLAARRGFRFALAGVPLHLLYFSCCWTAFVLGIVFHCRSRLSLKLGLFMRAPARGIAMTALICVPPLVIAAFRAFAAGSDAPIAPANWLTISLLDWL